MRHRKDKTAGAFNHSSQSAPEVQAIVPIQSNAEIIIQGAVIRRSLVESLVESLVVYLESLVVSRVDGL